MKTLTIKQPFADLIMNGLKDIENRSQKTNYRGRILIHASVFPAKDISKNIELEARPCLDLRSCILGSVVIADCVREHPSPWAMPGHWHWVLKDAIRFEHPIMNVRGALGLWEYDTSEMILQKAAELGAGLCKGIEDCRECHVYNGCFKIENYTSFF